MADESNGNNHNSAGDSTVVKVAIPVSAASILTIVFYVGGLVNRIESLERIVREMGANAASISRIEQKLEFMGNQLSELKESQRRNGNR